MSRARWSEGLGNTIKDSDIAMVTRLTESGLVLLPQPNKDRREEGAEDDA